MTDDYVFVDEKDLRTVAAYSPEEFIAVTARMVLAHRMVPDEDGHYVYVREIPMKLGPITYLQKQWYAYYA